MLAFTAVFPGCASLTVDALPQPGSSYRDGYDVIAEFDNVLNLPERAKVTMDGSAVGLVTGMELTPTHVRVTLRIDRGVRIPSDIYASVQQATVLGNTYVALDRSAANASTSQLHDGSRIPLEQTTSPPQLEDTIAHLANFVTSGSIQRLQNSIIGLNRVTPSGDTARQIAHRVAADLADLSEGIETVDHWLRGVSGTGTVLKDRLTVFDEWFSPKGMLAFDRISTGMSYVGTLLPSAGSVYSGGYWLVPLLSSVADMFGAMQRDKQAFEEEVPAWREFYYDYFLPLDKFPAMNITSIIGPDGRELSGDVQDVLRIIGAAP
ncbi:mammalian cell entry protein [Mycobacterium sp. 1274756.6]|nr:mammalian cell entry protein [Mycobacterium sp. 1274756.6]